MSDFPYNKSDQRERAVLVAVDTDDPRWPTDDSLSELARLADTAGLEVVAEITQRLDHPNPATFIGKGKVEEVKQLVTANKATTVIFDDELTPSQEAKLENLIPDTKIGDRTALILDIFALHAQSKEGKLQVELAQMEYLLPRLRGMWRHLDAIAGGGVLTRGPGESQLETDRRLARKRITELKRELKRVESHRQTQRKQRLASNAFRISLVGYTNAGKSSLLNKLTGADVLAYDRLFATLDSTTRQFVLPEGRQVTITDTVGFIQKLPHGLVEAFKSTLDEVHEADLLLRVTDGSSPQMTAQMQAVGEVLTEIGAEGVDSLVVFNKIDLLNTREQELLRERYPDALFVSARTGEGVEALIDRIAAEAARGDEVMQVLIPFREGELVSLAHESCAIASESHTDQGTALMMRVPKRLTARFVPFLVEKRQA